MIEREQRTVERRIRDPDLSLPRLSSSLPVVCSVSLRLGTVGGPECVETNVCMLFTACSALTNGFETIILAECVTASQMRVHNEALQIIEMAQGRVISTRDFLNLLER